jgi:AraC-like DNA-binding protein
VASSQRLATFLGNLRDPFTAASLFDQLPDIVYFIKDQSGRYLEVNETLIHRCGCARKSDIIGQLPSQLFGPDLGMHYETQDRTVLQHGRSLMHLLELHMYKSRHVGWCLTTKLPLYSKGNAIVGLVGVSRDLKMPDVSSDDFQRIAAAIDAARDNLSTTTTVANIAAVANMSPWQLDRRMKRVFGISTCSSRLPCRSRTSPTRSATRTRVHLRGSSARRSGCRRCSSASSRDAGRLWVRAAAATACAAGIRNARGCSTAR